MGDEGNTGFMAATAAGSDLHAATGCVTALEILGELERRRPKKYVAAFLMAQSALDSATRSKPSPGCKRPPIENHEQYGQFETLALTRILDFPSRKR